MDYDAIFKESLDIGLEGEELLSLIAKAYEARGEDAVQVKNDQKVSKTSNVYVERESRGKVSGIDDSRCPYWAFVLDGDEFNRDVLVIIKTERLREICRRSGYGNIKGGDSDTARGYLIPIDKLVKPLDAPRLFPEQMAPGDVSQRRSGTQHKDDLVKAVEYIERGEAWDEPNEVLTVEAKKPLDKVILERPQIPIKIPIAHHRKRGVVLRGTDGRIIDWPWCLAIWDKLGQPVIYAEPGDPIYGLSLYMYPERLSPRRLQGIVNWLEEHSRETTPSASGRSL